MRPEHRERIAVAGLEQGADVGGVAAGRGPGVVGLVDGQRM
jgi:hypothetical protein